MSKCKMCQREFGAFIKINTLGTYCLDCFIQLAVDWFAGLKSSETECQKLMAELAALRKEQSLLKEEKQIFLGLFQGSHSEMDDPDYLNWYNCVVKMLRAFKDGKRGVDVTIEWDEHPELYEAPCYCQLCRSYGD